MQCYQQALETVSNPNPNQSPLLRRMAWAILKQKRGVVIRTSTLPKAEKANGQ